MNKKGIFIAVVAAMTIAFMMSPAVARQYMVGGRPLNLFGYVTQSVGIGLDDDKYDTEEGVNAALLNILVEGEYSINDQLTFYASGMFSKDWAYDLKHDDRSWNDKLFSQSRDKLYIDDEYWQVLKEAHLTWTPGDFYFRGGKQIVKWGETNGFRLMDQINPADKRRGLGDVEFETSVIPIWLVRAEYYAPIQSIWLQDLGFEFVFNPNVDFIPNQGSTGLGGDVGGIWAPNVEVPGPFPGGFARVGSAVYNIDEPDGSEGFEYAARIKAVAYDTMITLNAFSGRDDSPALLGAPGRASTFTSDGTMILHPGYVGYYPRFRFAGLTVARDIPGLKAGFLGGVAPSLSLEAFYGFDSTFPTSINTLVKSDELRWALTVDWKVKIPLLNPMTYFSISPTFYHQTILDYPTGCDLKMQEDNSMYTLMIKTQYLHGTITPVFFWMHDVDNDADLYKAAVIYKYSEDWQYTLGAIFLDGKEPGKGFHVFENKDYISFKISYKWN